MAERKDRNSFEYHEQRRRESLEIDNQGELVAAGVSTIAMLTKNPLESCIDVKNKALKTFESGSRNVKLEMITNLQNTCFLIAPVLNPGCSESSLAKNLRRLSLIQRVVVGEIATGELAGQVADLVMGRFRFETENTQLYREWAEKKL